MIPDVPKKDTRGTYKKESLKSSNDDSDDNKFVEQQGRNKPALVGNVTMNGGPGSKFNLVGDVKKTIGNPVTNYYSVLVMPSAKIKNRRLK